MFKREATSKLPTLLQYLKEHSLREEQVSEPIEKVFWSDEWRTITFQTEVFRYSIKFGSEDEYENAYGDVLDGYQPNCPMLATVHYDGTDGTVDIEWEALSPTESNAEYKQFRQWDWGLTSEPFKPKPKSPARKKKPSSKKAAPKPPDTPPTTSEPEA